MCQPLPSRRDALKAALAATAGLAFWPAEMALAELPEEAARLGSFALPLASYPVLRTVGGSVVVSIPTATGAQARLVVTKTADAAYAAVSAFCTHEGTVVGAYSSATGRITCPNHGAQFTATGTVTRGPASTALPAYPAVYEAASDSVRITLSSVTSGEEDPRVAALGFAASPTVVRAATTVRFRLDAPAPVRLVVYDTLGREVAVLLDGPAAGDVTATWDARGVAAGVYVLRLVAGDQHAAASVRVAR